MCFQISLPIIPIADRSRTVYKLFRIRFGRLMTYFTHDDVTIKPGLVLKSSRRSSRLQHHELYTGNVRHGLHCIGSLEFAKRFLRGDGFMDEFIIVELKGKLEDFVICDWAKRTPFHLVYRQLTVVRVVWEGEVINERLHRKPVTDYLVNPRTLVV